MKAEILRWALGRAGMSEREAGRKVAGLGKWLAEENVPNLRQLERFAKITQTPLGFFFLEKPPQESLPIP